MNDNGKWPRILRKLTPWFAVLVLLAGGLAWWDAANYPVPGNPAGSADPFGDYSSWKWNKSMNLWDNVGILQAFLRWQKVSRKIRNFSLDGTEWSNHDDNWACRFVDENRVEFRWAVPDEPVRSTTIRFERENPGMFHNLKVVEISGWDYIAPHLALIWVNGELYFLAEFRSPQTNNLNQLSLDTRGENSAFNQLKAAETE
ncbi:MAG: hypothetical protein HKN23_21955 [Verrucomicrobiales bacterium]|nr:hypothetical protein [Verrucomicrobiales bacterium]